MRSGVSIQSIGSICEELNARSLRVWPKKITQRAYPLRAKLLANHTKIGSFESRGSLNLQSPSLAEPPPLSVNLSELF